MAVNEIRSLTPSCSKVKVHNREKSAVPTPHRNDEERKPGNFESLESYLHFYETIPNYSDLHHLSDDEFYERLRALKETQKSFYEHSSPTNDLSSKQLINDQRTCHCCQCPEEDSFLKQVSALSVRCDPTRHFIDSKGIKSNHEVPLTSKIPLFDKIMAQQEERRRLSHAKNSRDLQAMVRPFSFTRREEEERHNLQKHHHLLRKPISDELTRSKCCSRMSGRSSSCLPCSSESTRFRARPVPREAYASGKERHNDQQFHRAVQKSIRADTLLKQSALPPRMAAEHARVIAKSLDHIPISKQCGVQRKRRPHSHSATTTTTTTTECSSNNSASPDYIDGIRTACTGSRRSRSRSNRRARSVRRINNLASVLRMQSSRSRAEQRMQEDLQEQRRGELVRHKERLMRMTPAWRTLDYNLDDDLELRLEQRRIEAKNNQTRHDILMDDIYGRVHNMTPLFQNPKRTVKRHKCNINNTVKCKSLESSLDMRSTYDVNYFPKRSHSFYKTDAISNNNLWIDAPGVSKSSSDRLTDNLIKV